MLIHTPKTNDDDLERLFADARRYPLLSAQEEREIDAAKWDVVCQLQQLMAADPTGRDLLRQWCEACLEHPPVLEDFPYRQYYFLLRRELSELDLGKSGRAHLETLRCHLLPTAAPGGDPESVKLVAIPPGLTIALAHSLLGSPEADDPGGVAAALSAWRDTWPGVPSKRPLEAPVKARIRKLLSLYKSSRDQLVTHNLRLVYSVAGRYRNKGIAFLDLVQEGVLGLIRAAEKYEHSKGFRFSTYAFNWIAQAIRRCIQESSGAIRQPSHVQELLGKLYKERSHHWLTAGKMPNDRVLANSLGISTEKTRSLLQMSNFAKSVDTPMYDGDSDATILDSMAGGPFNTTTSEAEQVSLHRSLLKEIAQLEPAEQQVVISRWGLQQRRPLSRAEIADQLSVSREWVRQLERSALDKLRHNEKIHSLYQDDNEVSTC